MSFYGNVFYEFAQLFRNFVFKNNGFNKTTLVTNKPADAEAVAQERWDILTMDTGNRWIVLEGNQDGVTFSHAGPGTAELKPQIKPIDNYSLNGSGTSGTPYILNYDETFSVPTFTFQFDKAGHYVTKTSSNVYFKMPPAPDPEELYEAGAPDLMTDNATAAGFNKVTSASGATELKAGDTFATNTITFTDKGTVKAVNTNYYKLPVSETEKNLTALTDAVDSLQQDMEKIPNTYATKTAVNGLVGTVTALGTKVEAAVTDSELTDVLENYLSTKDAAKTYATQTSMESMSEEIKTLNKQLDDVETIAETIGSIDDFYIPDSKVTEKFKTVTSAIGDLETNTTNMYPADTPVKTVAEQIATVSNRVGALDNLYSGEDSTLKPGEQFESITAALGDLEASSHKIFGDQVYLQNVSQQLQAAWNKIQDYDHRFSTQDAAIAGLKLQIEQLEKQLNNLT